VLRNRLRASGWRIVNSTPFPLVCFTREGLDPTEFLAALHKRQIAWMSAARVGDTPVVRACITSFKTTEEDIRWVVNEMNRLIEPETTISLADEEQYATAGQGRGNR
jgi:aromatic-L-amino-acid/L-tryptophan decarboxylase